MYPNLQIQKINNGQQGDEDMILLESPSSQPSQTHSCCGNTQQRLQFVVAIGLLVYGIGAGSLLAITTMLRISTMTSAFGLIFAVMCFGLSVFCFYTMNHASTRPLTRHEAIVQAICFWLSTAVLFGLSVVIGIFAGHMAWAGLINTGVDGCYDACGPAVLFFIFAMTLLVPLLVINVISLIVSIMSIKNVDRASKGYMATEL